MIKKPFWRIPADLFGHFFFRIFKWKKTKQKPVRHPDTQSKTSMTGCNTHLSSNHYHMLQKSTVVYCWPHLCSSSLLTETLFCFVFLNGGTDFTLVWNWWESERQITGSLYKSLYLKDGHSHHDITQLVSDSTSLSTNTSGLTATCWFFEAKSDTWSISGT